MALVAYLSIASPRGFHQRDKLLGLFWPELDQPHARNALSQALHVVRTSLGDAAVVTRGDDQVAISTELVRSDVAQFETALAAGRLEEALELYKGEILDGFFVTGAPEFDRWLDGERARYQHRASDAAWMLARRKADQGDTLAAARHAEWATALVPPDETQLRQLMTFLHSLGDRSAALRAYDSFAHEFARDYELEPSAETQALAGRIRNDLGSAQRGENETVGTVPHPAAGGVPPKLPGESLVGATRWSQGFAAIAVVLVAIIVISLGLKTRSPNTTAVGHVPRLVVFPFQNLGAPDNSYFAEGIGDEIATRLTMMRGLHVISGAATKPYREARSDPARASDNGGADYFLEGTASWLPSTAGRGHLRVRVQLINAHDARQMWGAVVDEDIKAANEIFSIFSDVAQRVVNEIDVVLETPAPSPRVSFPTTNLEAYNDYLRGTDYMRRTSTKINFAAAIQNLEHAVALDSNFALAYAKLSNAETQAVWLGGMNRAHCDTAKIVGDRALGIDPNLPDGHTYLGAYYYACGGDYPRALWHFAKSNALRPGNYEVAMYVGNVEKRQGRFDEAINQYRLAARLDPLARWPRNNLGHAQMWARRYDDAERTFRAVLASEPQDIFAYAHLAWLLVLRDGDTRVAWQIVNQARGASEGFGEMRVPYYLALVDRNYDAALASLTPPEPGLTTSLLNEWLVNDEIRRGLVFRLKSDTAAAKTSFDSARVELEAALRITSLESKRDQLWLRSGLAIVYAGLHRTDEAIAQIDFVTTADPLEVDAIEGPKYLQHLALAHVLLGNRERAIDVLERLLSVGAPVSPKSLRLEPFWDPLRSDARFARVLAASR